MKELITKPLVLIGIMGSGKTTIGKKIAKKLNLQFYDSDRVIEEREGLSVVDIYDFKGGPYFQAKEQEVVKEILSYGITVLSTGGSTFLNEDLRSIIKEKAISVWLSADIDVLYNRVAKRNTRPELNCENKLEVLKKMIDECYPIYNQADIIIQSNDFDAHYIVDSLMARLKKYFNC